jgi:tetratricopeptide (TPR) repeat protein
MTSFLPRGYSAVTVRSTPAALGQPSHLARAQAAAQAFDHATAILAFEKALEQSPNDTLSKIGLGQSLCATGRRTEGTAQLRSAGAALATVARTSGDLAPLLDLVAKLHRWSDFAGALELCNAGLAITGADFRVHQLLAVTYSQLNQISEALAAGQRALELDPENSMMHILQASLEADAGMNAAAKDRLEDVLTYELHTREEFRAHKELARVLDKLGQFDQAFKHLHASATFAQALPEVVKHDKTLIPQMIASHRAGFDAALLARWAGAKFEDQHPPLTFLVGFMRSGTTLTQEVLDAHPGVLVADEADFVWAMHRELHLMDKSAGSTADKLRKLDLQGIQRLRDCYWARVHHRLGDTLGDRMLVDKFTMNTIDLGLINVVFPDAKVVFVMRDPRDVCVSCFMQLMVPSPATVHLMTWQGTAEFYALVMDWWMLIKPRLSMDVIEFRYEDAVTDFEATFRKVFAFVGLGWDAGVQDFHKRAALKFIATPSRNQVRQPLYTSSVTRWKKYEAEVASVADCLAPFVQAFDYEPS